MRAVLETLRALQTEAATMLILWTIYEKPRDFPHDFIARKWVVDKRGAHPTDEIIRAPTLIEIRAMLPAGLFPLSRRDGDDSVIVEVWI